MFRYGIASVVLIAFVTGSNLWAQDTDEVRRLKERIELLETKLKLAEKENELLRQENEQLKVKTPRGKEVAKNSLSDLLPEGAVLSGDYRSSFIQDAVGKLTITISERDGKKVKGTAVTKWNDKGPAEFSFEGEIKGNQLALRSVGGSLKRNITVTLKGEGLEGTWSDSSLQKGTVGFKLSK